MNLIKKRGLVQKKAQNPLIFFYFMMIVIQSELN